MTEFYRHKIIILHQQGISQREIGKQTGYSRNGIQVVIKKFEESGEVKDKKGLEGQENFQNLISCFSTFLL